MSTIARTFVENLEPRKLLAGVFVEQNGLLMVEIESEPTRGWTRVTSPSGYTGSAAYQWNGADYFHNPGNAKLTYDFKINNSGTYSFKLRSYNITNDPKEFNDVWVRIDGQKWEKIFQSRNKQWTWFTRREVSHGVYDTNWNFNLSAGRHTIEFSARSNKFIIDRFALHKSGVSYENPSIPPSPTTSDPVPNPPPTNSSGTISGFLWNDTDADGVVDSTESRTGSRTVFLDQNRNGKLDAGEKSTTSDSQGNYRFTGLSAGTYYVTRVFPAGYRLSNDPSGHVAVTLGQNENKTATNLGTTRSSNLPPSIEGTISGFLWNDSNRNGIPDFTESRTGSRTVFLDQNRNGKLDTGEKSTTSDSQGNYRFTGLSAGTYYVTRVFPSGYRLSNNALGYVQVTLNKSAEVNLGSRII